MFALTLALGLASAFVPPTSLQQVSRVTVSPAAVTMFSGSGKSSPKKAAPKPAGKKLGNIFGGAPASPTKPTVTNKAKPLSPGSNYPTTKNIQTQKSGFGSFVQKFQTVRRRPETRGPRVSVAPLWRAEPPRTRGAERSPRVGGAGLVRAVASAAVARR